MISHYLTLLVKRNSDKDLYDTKYLIPFAIPGVEAFPFNKGDIPF